MSYKVLRCVNLLMCVLVSHSDGIPTKALGMPSSRNKEEEP
jgi:hypothetical protein